MSSKDINKSGADSINNTSREDVMLEFENIENIILDLNFFDLYDNSQTAQKQA